MTLRETLIDNFLQISSIPRGSGHEKRIADFFVTVARRNGLYCFKDNNNNILIRKPGNIASKPVALQAHLDMVCVKTTNSKHDFTTDGIEVVIDGDRVTAKDTSLGADQGVGLALMLTIMEDRTLKHPDLEFLFTVEEETTFNGVINFPYDQVKSKRMINLDNSRDDAVFVGAAGDVCNEYVFHGELSKTSLPSYRVLLKGFPGGNSGEDIEASSNNAIVVMAKILKDKEVLLSGINGGVSENDLATSCEVVISTLCDVDTLFAGFDTEIESIDNDLVFSAEYTRNILNEILNLKGGYIANTMASANLGLIATDNNTVSVQYILRSMDSQELEELNKQSKELDYHFVAREVYRDSAWKVNCNSELLAKYKEVYWREYGEYPTEITWHGGIECAAIKNRIADLDLISVGSIIRKYHTTEEVTFISSWLKIYHLLVKLLAVI